MVYYQVRGRLVWQFYRPRGPSQDCQRRRRQNDQNGDNWCISPTNYPASAPLSNWSFLYFTIFAVFPFPFVYLSPLFRIGQWARPAHYSHVALARDPPLNLLRNSSELPDNKARFFGWLIGVRITFCFFPTPTFVGSIAAGWIDFLNVAWDKSRGVLTYAGLEYRGRGSH